MFLGGIEMEHWAKTGEIKFLESPCFNYKKTRVFWKIVPTRYKQLMKIYPHWNNFLLSYPLSWRHASFLQSYFSQSCWRFFSTKGKDLKKPFVLKTIFKSISRWLFWIEPLLFRQHISSGVLLLMVVGILN